MILSRPREVTKSMKGAAKAMVYVVQRPRPRLGPDGTVCERDLRPAMEFGSLRYIFEAEERAAFQPSLGLDRVREVLSAFDPHEDYMLWPSMGDPATLYLVLLTLGGMRLPSVRFLYWSRELDQETGQRTRKGHYWVFTVDLNNHWMALMEPGRLARFEDTAMNGSGKNGSRAENRVWVPTVATTDVAPLRRIGR